MTTLTFEHLSSRFDRNKRNLSPSIGLVVKSSALSKHIMNFIYSDLLVIILFLSMSSSLCWWKNSSRQSNHTSYSASSILWQSSLSRSNRKLLIIIFFILFRTTTCYFTFFRLTIITPPVKYLLSRIKCIALFATADLPSPGRLKSAISLGRVSSITASTSAAICFSRNSISFSLLGIAAICI